jgi:hypothetical protein
VVDFWSLFDELYSDQAYLCAFADWLSDTEGDEAPVTVAVRMLVDGRAVVRWDGRGHVGPPLEYDLFINDPRIRLKSFSALTPEFIHTHRVLDDNTQDAVYFEFLKNHPGWRRGAGGSPLELLKRFAKSIKFSLKLDPSIILPPENVTSY